MKEEYWKMKDGTKIAVGDMTESHVRNALRMVIRKTEDSCESERRELLMDAAAGYDCENYGDR